MEQLIRDLCSVEFRSKSKTKRLIEDYTKKVREETIREVEVALPEEAPPIIDILMTEEEYKHNEVIRARISGFNSCLGVVKEELNKLKK